MWAVLSSRLAIKICLITASARLALLKLEGLIKILYLRICELCIFTSCNSSTIFRHSDVGRQFNTLTINAPVSDEANVRNRSVNKRTLIGNLKTLRDKILQQTYTNKTRNKNVNTVHFFLALISFVHA